MNRLFAPNTPFQPAALPFFYGWAIVAAGTSAMLFSLPGQTAGVGPFKVHMMAALGVESIDMSLAYMCGTIASGLTLPMMGGLFDRIGARKVGVVAAVALGLSLLFISQTDRIMHALVGQATLWVSMPLMILAFFAIRFWGQGVFSIVSRAMIGKWFDRQRGLASAISGVPVSAAFTCSLLIMSWVMELCGGWRQAWIAMGAFMLVPGALFCWLIFRDNPEECGLEMDGGYVAAKDRPNEAEFAIHQEFTARQALRTWPFWVFSLTICLNGFVGTALAFHAATMAEQFGMLPDELYKLFAKTVFVNIPVSFFIGWMTSRFRLKFAYLFTCCGMGLGLFGFANLPSEWGRWLFILGTGVSWGSFGTLLTVTWPRFYGRRHLGSISSWVMTLMVITSALGPVFFDLSDMLSGSYRAAILASVGLCVVSLIFCLRMENPQRRLAKGVG